MKRSYLVQRLMAPHHNKGVEAFSFGGGFVNGGLTEDAMKLLRPVFSFDYMGAAEFEFGAVPEALSSVFRNHDNYKTFSINVKTVRGNSADVYVIALDEWRDEITERLNEWAKSGCSQKHGTKEGVNLNLAIDDTWPFNDEPISESIRPHGWLELNNGYFFFTDNEMFEKVCQLFEIKE